VIKLGCGNCGNSSFDVFEYSKDNAILIMCRECKSETLVMPSESKLNLRFKEGSKGILCDLNSVQES
jgi:ferredoxin